ncbi:uncharacterized protein V1516DRAFT_675476 [Lipomyces oligophaga]|uniref:uncharacterized protein n=1 Tax=Lipomyces oligophaga TaxID=45792 RepID=UPI0034CFDD1F
MILVNCSYAIYKSSPTVCNLDRDFPANNPSQTRRNLESVRNRLLPLLDPSHNFTSEQLEGQWNTRHWINTDQNQSLIVHDISFAACRFVILLSPSNNQLILFVKSSKQLSNSFIDWLEFRLDIIIRTLELPSQLLHRFLDDYIRAAGQNSSRSAIELEFTTGLKELARLTISLNAEDVEMFAIAEDSSPVHRILNHVVSSTSINVSELQLARVSCSGGIIRTEGKIKLISGSASWQALFAKSWIFNISELVFQ